MRQYGDDKDYSLSGHSLGGSIALNTMEQSKSIRDRVKEVHVFNPGYTGLFHGSIKPKDKKVKRELDKKVNIHRVKGDIVSAHANKEVAFGNLFEYTHKDKDADLSDKHSLETFMEAEL
jgi:alpha-beta hydrolase superfamily lysophospholipase